MYKSARKHDNNFVSFGNNINFIEPEWVFVKDQRHRRAVIDPEDDKENWGEGKTA